MVSAGRLCPTAKRPSTNPWLSCQLGYAGGVKRLSLRTHPPGKQHEGLNSSHTPSWKNPAGSPEAGGTGAASPVPGSTHDPCPLAMASHRVPVCLPN